MNTLKIIILILIFTFSMFHKGFSQIKRENNNFSKQSYHLGCGFSVYNLGKSTNQYISDPIGPFFNINFSNKRFIMLYTANFSETIVVSENLIIGANELKKKNTFQFWTISLSFGYNYRPSERIQINPFGGLIYSDIMIKDNPKNPTILGLTSGINTQLILNTKDENGKFVYIFLTHRFNWKSFKELNPNFDNIAFQTEIGVAYRFIMNKD